MAATFGLAGIWWRRLPARITPLLPAIGLFLCAAGYLAIAASAPGGGQGGVLMWADLVWLAALSAAGVAATAVLARAAR